MNGRRTAIGFTLVAAGSLAVLWLSNLPLGVPGEWEWDRIPVVRGESLAVVLGWLLAGLVGGPYIALTLIGARRLRARPRWQVAGWLGGLTVGGFAWLWAVQDSPADPASGMAKTGWVLYNHGTEGYFEQARYVMRDVPSYLAGYEQVMAQGDVLHLGTHPPGLMLFHRACIKLCGRFSLLRDFLTAHAARIVPGSARPNRGAESRLAARTDSDRPGRSLAGGARHAGAGSRHFDSDLPARRARPIRAPSRG